MNRINSKSLLCKSRVHLQGQMLCVPAWSCVKPWLVVIWFQKGLVSSSLWHRLQERGNEKHQKSATFIAVILSRWGSLCYAALAVLEQVCCLVFGCFIYKDRTWEQSDSSIPCHEFIYQIIGLWYGTDWPQPEIIGILSKGYFGFIPIAVLSFMYSYGIVY